jgi:hypothetical protein
MIPKWATHTGEVQVTERTVERIYLYSNNGEDFARECEEGFRICVPNPGTVRLITLNDRLDDFMGCLENMKDGLGKFEKAAKKLGVDIREMGNAYEYIRDKITDGKGN